MTPTEPRTEPDRAPPDEAAAERRFAQLAAAVQAERRAVVSGPHQAPRPRARRRRPWTGWVLWLGVLVVVPFFVLIGGAVWLYRFRAVPVWVALAVSGLLATATLTLAAARGSHRLTGRARIRFIATRLAGPAVLGYCLYGLLVLSPEHAKTEEVRTYYRTVHPLLRLALRTAILADGDLVITDAFRTPEDYGRMGLPTLDNSLHFRQTNGYVHAVDLRTRGRSAIRNGLTAVYFRGLGFRTLRHVGTADHLHVSLAPPGDRRR